MVNNVVREMEIPLVNVRMVGLVVLVQDVMANQEPLDTVFLVLPVPLNAQFAHTREKNVVGLLVGLVTLKLVNAFAKHPTLVEPAVIVLVMLVLLVTTYQNQNLNLNLLLMKQNVLFVLSKVLSVEVLLMETVTENQVIALAKQGTPVVLAVLVEIKLEIGQNPLEITSAQFAHTREKNVVVPLVEHVTEILETVLVKHPTLVEPAVTVLVTKVLLDTTLALLKQILPTTPEPAQETECGELPLLFLAPLL